MLQTRLIRPLSSLLAVAAAALALSSEAARAAPLPPVQTQGDIGFVSGGVDDDSARAFQAEQARWPVTLEFAVKDRPVNSFLANVQVQVRNAAGDEVLDTVSDGPFMLVRLAPGTYQVTARFGGKAMATVLHVKADGSTKQVFMWPHAYLHAEG